MSFLILFSFLVINAPSVLAQEFQHLFGDYPFSTSLEVETLTSGAIKENMSSGSFHSQKMGNSKVGVFARYFELNTSKVNVSNYYNIQLGGSYRHYFKNDKSLGITGSLGSSSDRPFRDSRDGTILINTTYKLDEKWVLLGNYSNNRTFLNNIPLPGFIYIQEQSREKSVLLGFPFLYILKPFYHDIFSFKYIGVLPYNHKLRILFNNWSLFKPYLGFEQGPIAFFDSDRNSNKMRTFWFERKAILGIEKSFGPFLKLDFQIGNSFDRKFFYAQSFARKHFSVLKVEDGIYGSLNLRSSF